MSMIKSLSFLIITAFVSGCATLPPEEAPITASVQAPAGKVQFEIETIVTTAGPKARVKSQTENMMVIETDCMDVPRMDAFQCSMIMMGIGNSGWSGPFHIQTYRFVETAGVTQVRSGWQWCAINGFGRESCMNMRADFSNKVLRALEARIQAQTQTASK